MTNEELAAICRERTPRSLALFYECMFHDRGLKMPDHLLPVVYGLCDTRIQKLMLIVGPGSGKALHPDTLVLTDKGWRPIKLLRAGSRVMTPDGVTYATVRGVFHQPKSRLYRVRFADGREIKANADHLWLAYTKKFGTVMGTRCWRVRRTDEIADYMTNPRRNKWYIPLPKPIDGPDIDLPLDPYILGCVLGDGHISATGFCTFTCFDDEIVGNVRIAGYLDEQHEGFDVTTSHRAAGHFGLLGLGKTMCDLGLRDCRSWDKFVPDIYMSGSKRQRLALLQGLMDTDGTVDAQKTVSFASTSIKLASAVRDLVRSLGGIAQISERSPTFTYNGEKREGRPAYQVNIRHPEPHTLFTLSRKIERTRNNQYSGNLKLEIESVTLCDEYEESVCINIDHPDGLFVAENYVVTHNSLLVSVAYPAWKIGYDPTLTILGVSGAENSASTFMQAVMDTVQFAPIWKIVYPAVLPKKSSGWGGERGMFVEGHATGDPDANFWAGGLTSRALTTKHARLIIFDDLHNDENSATEAACQQVVDKYYSLLAGRADPRGARFILAGRRFNQNDLYGHFQNSEEWVVLRLPAERPGQRHLYFDVFVPDGMECVYTDRLVYCEDDKIVPV